MDERVKFIARLLEGEKMAGLCEEFGISRKTGYKIPGRARQRSTPRLDRSTRRPIRLPQQQHPGVRRHRTPVERGDHAPVINPSKSSCPEIHCVGIGPRIRI